MKKKCVVCESDFEANNWATKSCSDECRKKHNTRRQKVNRENNLDTFCCSYCGKEVTRFRIRNGFCSRSCASKKYTKNGTYDEWRLRTNERKGIFVNCCICGDSFYAKPKESETRKVCNKKECKSKNHSNWMNANNPQKGSKASEESKIKKTTTLLNRYGVTNAYMLAKHKTLSRPQQELSSIISDKTALTVITDAAIEKENRRYKLDILLVEKKIAIEFNGTYWHCDPRFYEASYHNKKKNLTASQIWQYDEERKVFLENNDYKVLTIWEFDYKIDKENTINKLLEYISE
jgi:G:T-mismatch repair DNA endonuclease (very short patch repair protein)